MASDPLIGVTLDLEGDRYACRRTYVRAVIEAGGVPVLLPHEAGMAERWLEICSGFILTGGDDPIMERWGIATHPEARTVHPDRQASELELLDALARKSDVPALGICLGMQYMALHAGGRFDQHLPDTLSTAAAHRHDAVHLVRGDFNGSVTSHHRQAVTDPGRLDVGARADDGVIEAIVDRARPFYVGVQWHPERTADPELGIGLIRRLVEAARRAQ